MNRRDMKTFRGYLAEVATFSPKNFPSDVGKNRDFTGAGERTTYAPEVLTDYKFKEGFPMEKPAPLYSEDGTVVKQLKKGETVHFTIPATLHRSTEFGITRRTTLAPVSLKGFDSPDCFLYCFSSPTREPPSGPFVPEPPFQPQFVQETFSGISGQVGQVGHTGGTICVFKM